MKTTEKRVELIQKRTAELKRKKQQQLRACLSAAACLVLIVGVGMVMPDVMQKVSGGSITHTSGAASLVGEHAALGYILMGLLCFLLGITLTILLYQLRQKQDKKQQEESDEF